MITFKFIINKNERNLIKKCFQLFMKNFYYLQYRLDIKLYTNKFIYIKLINICQDILTY